MPESNHVILITGASSGIGSALAERLATEYMGIRLVLAARNQEKLEQVAERCQKRGAEVLVVPTDMAEVEQVKALAATALEKFGTVDALVNNAGYGQMGAVELISPEEAKRQFAVNFHGPLVLTQALIPVMREKGGGRIVNVSSIGGLMAFPTGGMYSSSKFALEALTDVLRMELEPFNIRAIAIEPGPVSTEFFSVANQEVAQSAARTEEEIDTLYQATFERLQGLEQLTKKRAWSSDRVARVIVRALSDPKPRPRYIAATGGNTLVFLMRKVLPTWMSDFFWKRFYAVDRVEKAWKLQAKN